MKDVTGLTHALASVKTLSLGLVDFLDKYGEYIVFESDGAGYRYKPGSGVRIDLLPPLEITADDVRVVLRKFLDGQVTAQDLRAWANFLILCEAFDFKSDRVEQRVIASVLHELASPELFGEPSTETIERLLQF